MGEEKQKSNHWLQGGKAGQDRNWEKIILKMNTGLAFVLYHPRELLARRS